MMIYAFLIIFLNLSTVNLFPYADPKDPNNRDLQRLSLPKPTFSKPNTEYGDFIQLVSAIRYGNLKIVEKLCNKSPWVIEEIDEGKNMAIHHAVQSNHKNALAIVKVLIRNCSENNPENDPYMLALQNEDGDTPLDLAQNYGRKDVYNYIKELLDDATEPVDSDIDEEQLDDETYRISESDDDRYHDEAKSSKYFSSDDEDPYYDV